MIFVVKQAVILAHFTCNVLYTKGCPLNSNVTLFLSLNLSEKKQTRKRQSAKRMLITWLTWYGDWHIRFMTVSSAPLSSSVFWFLWLLSSLTGMFNNVCFVCLEFILLYRNYVQSIQYILRLVNIFMFNICIWWFKAALDEFRLFPPPL